MNKSTLSPEQNLSPDAPIRVPLGYDDYALIDAADAVLVVQYHWVSVKPNGVKTYAVCWVRDADGKKRTLFLHRLLMNPPDEVEVDHINGDGLDCRRSNMRFADHFGNNQNKRQQKNSQAPYKGITYRQDQGKWRARIYHRGRHMTLGQFETAEEAARVYDRAAKQFFGEFAYLNFPDEEAA